VYAALAAIFWTRNGVPILGDRLTVWVLGLLLAVSIANPGRFVRGLVFDWLPFLGALTAYDLLRGVADGSVLPAHARPQIWIDQYVFGFGTVPSVFLQRQLWDPAHVRVWDYATWVLYMSHFFMTPLIAAALWWWAPARFRRFAVVVVTTSGLAMLTYFLYPAVPPWLASETHLIPPVTRTIGLITNHVPVIDARTLYESGTAWSNAIAAMPSLHEGLAVVASIALWPLANRTVRTLLVLYPLAMGFALVYSGEHYVIEIVAGVAYAFAANALAGRILGWRSSRAERTAGVQAPARAGEAYERAA
jgi:hypothetical protein